MNRNQIWVVLMVIVAVTVAIDIVLSSCFGRPVSVYTALAAAGYIAGYCIARLAEAWGERLWADGGDR